MTQIIDENSIIRPAMEANYKEESEKTTITFGNYMSPGMNLVLDKDQLFDLKELIEEVIKQNKLKKYE